MNYIEPIKEKLDQKMHEQCVAFMLIGNQKETPRYLNFGGFDSNTKILKIESTQTRRVYFYVQTDFDFFDVEVHEFWAQFKEYRTKFLTDNYPKIETI